MVEGTKAAEMKALITEYREKRLAVARRRSHGTKPLSYGEFAKWLNQLPACAKAQQQTLILWAQGKTPPDPDRIGKNYLIARQLVMTGRNDLLPILEFWERTLHIFHPADPILTVFPLRG